MWHSDQPQLSLPLDGVSPHAGMPDAPRLIDILRLEIGGVVKGWAVPGGISLDPKVKRAALEVPDLPRSYLHFASRIPTAAAAGRVNLWQQGPYACVGGNAIARWQAGYLRITLYGQHLQGAWTLTRKKSHDRTNPKWVLRKVRDRFAQAGHQAVMLDHTDGMAR